MYGITRERFIRGLVAGAHLSIATLLLASAASAQVFVVGKEKPRNVPGFTPTSVVFSEKPITAAGRQNLIVSLAAEQGFAMRPIPLGAPGIVLHANGTLKYGSGDYNNSLVKKGISAKAGERVLITDFRIDKNKIVFDFNGGPEKKHKYLRHLSIGADPNYTRSVVNDDGVEPTGARLTLEFEKFVPQLTADDVRALIEPVIDFRAKSQLEVYTDALPPRLKAAILNHQPLVGMDRTMIVYALGQPERKVREREGTMPYEEWIYGDVPNPIQFVRFNGNRVIRVELALFGKTPTIRDQDEMDGYWGSHPTHTIQQGDVATSVNGDTPSGKAPSLRLPGEDLPQSAMQPVHNPTDKVPASPLPAPPGQQVLD